MVFLLSRRTAAPILFSISLKQLAGTAAALLGGEVYHYHTKVVDGLALRQE